MKKIWMMMAMVAIFTACSNEEELDSLVGNYTLTGYADIESRTVLAYSESSSIPFEWSPGDKVWAGNAQSNEITTGGNSATFTFASEPTGTVYYNMTGYSAQAKVYATQNIDNLGTNGDFGYGTINNGSFKLTHATAYLWFNVTSSISGAKLETIKVNADGSNIAGKATWNGSSFDNVTEGSSIIELTVEQTLTTTNNNVWAMVVLPANLQGKTVKVTYKLTVNDATKYYTQTLSGIDLPAGTTQKITANIANNDLTDYAELRVLTFEDNTEKFSPYTIQSYIHDTWDTGDYTNGTSFPIEKWSDLIPRLQKGDPLNYGEYDPSIYPDLWSAPLKTDYYWADINNTFLKHELRTTMVDLNWDDNPDAECTTYRNGGHAISNHRHVVINERAPNSNSNDWSDVMLSIPIVPKSGSNFCVHNGYHNTDDEAESLHKITFSDNVARVIDHMYVTNTSYVLHSLKYGDGFNDSAIPTTWFKIVATGYNGTQKKGTAEVMLCENGVPVEEWVKFDLSTLGQVTSIKFNVRGSADQYGDWGLNTPAYFAYDDVAVQF